MYSAEFLPDQIQSLCEEKARNWDHRIYFKRHQSNGMCVKVLFEIMSKISPKYNTVYQNIKNTIWSIELIVDKNHSWHLYKRICS